MTIIIQIQNAGRRQEFFFHSFSDFANVVCGRDRGGNGDHRQKTLFKGVVAAITGDEALVEEHH